MLNEAKNSEDFNPNIGELFLNSVELVELVELGKDLANCVRRLTDGFPQRDSFLKTFRLSRTSRNG